MNKLNQKKTLSIEIWKTVKSPWSRYNLCGMRILYWEGFVERMSFSLEWKSERLMDNVHGDSEVNDIMMYEMEWKCQGLICTRLARQNESVGDFERERAWWSGKGDNMGSHYVEERSSHIEKWVEWFWEPWIQEKVAYVQCVCWFWASGDWRDLMTWYDLRTVARAREFRTVLLL